MADYYETLGVAKDASQQEIRKAYLKLSRKLHPDHAGPEAEEQYKAVNEAYTVLSNEETRRKYDMGGPSMGMGGPGGFGFDMGDIFSSFFGGSMGGGGPVPRGERGKDILIRLSITLEEAVFGTTKELTETFFVRCATCTGNGCTPGTSPVTCHNCQGQGSVQRVTNSLFGQMVTHAPCPTCEGHGTVIASPCKACRGQGRTREEKTLSVKIPAGVDTGMRVRLAGRGDAGSFGAPEGDVYVEIQVQPHPIFHRVGDELQGEIQVPMTSAALGTTATIPTLDGDKEITIPTGTSSGYTVTLKGLGATQVNGRGRGDMKIRVAVKTPTNLDDRQEKLLRELAELRGETVSDVVLTEEKPGFFEKMREKFK
ncbi:molecular chaperone DnaJ [Actinotignum urinale]|uniref:molecular chaperone DnaJ n=1 Tax=Actinotignum urinale TaxID=190146 RepID=UPI00370D6A37